ncbi:MAG: sodium:calcium antiporter [Neisseriaceae bacterium]|jgi:cation:H+ antiporter
MLNILILIIALIIIVIAANLFCNALEHLGESLKISEGVTGSIFAAVGTALPETIIPIISIASSTKENLNSSIGIGAILGAPLMLSTLSIFVMSLSIIKQRGINGIISPEPTGLKRDLRFFLFGYTLAFIAIITHKIPFTHHSIQIINIIISITLGISYFIYIMLTIKSSHRLVIEGNQTSTDTPLFLTKFKFKKNGFSILIQLVIGIIILIYSAHVFIEQVNIIAKSYNFSPFLLALIIIPIATEMPEKINSIIWIRQKKDTLAIGNITGAMVFQGSLLPILGILFTNWDLKNPQPIIGILITMIATLWFYYNTQRNNIRVWQLWLNGILYAINLAICILA